MQQLSLFDVAPQKQNKLLLLGNYFTFKDVEHRITSIYLKASEVGIYNLETEYHFPMDIDTFEQKTGFDLERRDGKIENFIPFSFLQI